MKARSQPCSRRPGRADALRVGGHISLGAKPREKLALLQAQGYDCVQVHASSPRQWRLPNRTDEQLEVIRLALEESGLELFLHASYLINLASDVEAIYEGSIRTLIWNMQTAGKLGGRGVVFHVGSHRKQGFDAVRSRLAAAIARIRSDSPAEPMLILENSAGAGDCIGRSFSELGTIIDDAGGPDNLACCLDTAHAFAVGHDLRHADGVEVLLEEINESVGLPRLVVVHMNDSQTQLGACRDRHANIGHGCIGEAGFANLLAHVEITAKPLVLETPNLERRPSELALLRRLSSLREEAA